MSRFLKILEGLAGMVLGLMALLVIYQVVGRYVFGRPPSWTEELARYLQVWLVFLAAPVCLGRGMHLAVDYLTPQLSPVLRQIVRKGALALVGLFCLTLTVYGISLLQVAALQISPALGISMVWPYLAVPVSGISMTLVVVMLILDHKRGTE